MKKVIAFIISLICVTPIFSSAFTLSVDCVSLDFLLRDSLRIQTELSYEFRDVRLSLPLSFAKSYSEELSFFEGGLLLSIYPINNSGFNIGCSLLRCGLFQGYAAPSDRFLIFGEGFLGWTVRWKHLVFEPRVIFSDLFSDGEDEYATLKNAISQYSSLRIAVFLGVQF